MRFSFVLGFMWFVAFDGAVSQLAGRALVFRVCFVADAAEYRHV